MSKSQSKKSKSSSSSKTNDNSDDVQETVQVEFVAHKFESHDFNGIEKLLNQLFLRCSINLSDVADLLIKQNHIGSILKIDNPVSDDEASDEEDEEMKEDRKLQNELEDSMHVYGMVSVLSLTQEPLPACLKEIKEFLLKKSSKGDRNLRDLFARKNCNIGMIISDRFVNIPHDIAMPCYQALCTEMEKATKKGENYDFDYYVMLSKMYKVKGDRDTTVYVQAEEQYMFQNSEFTIEYSVADKKDQAISWEDGDEESCLLPYRQIFVLTKRGFNKSLEMLENDLRR